MAETNINDWMAYTEELNFAGGASGAELSEEALDDSQLSEMIIPMTVSFPFTRKELDNHRAFGMQEGKYLTFIKGIEKDDSSMDFYVISGNTMLFALASGTKIDESDYRTLGKKPPSLAFHIYNKNCKNVDAFGCYVDEYTWNASKDDGYLKETIKWGYYDTSQTANALTKVEWLSGYFPLTWDDVSFIYSGATDGQITLDATSATVKITNEYDMAGVSFKEIPYLKNKNWEISIETFDLLTGIDLSNNSANPQLEPKRLQISFGNHTELFTGMIVKLDNGGEITDEVNYKQKVTFKQGERWATARQVGV